jgi:membrane dipeptidase
MAPRILDLHNDTILKIVDQGLDITQRLDSGHIDIPRLRQGGVGCAVFACYASRHVDGDNAVQRADALLDAAARLAELPGLTLPTTWEELAALRDDDGQTGMLIAVEGGGALGGDLSRLDGFRARGVRYLTLAWGDNALTGSAFGEGGGLTALGRAAVRRLEELRILVDVSHMSDQAFQDTLDTARSPVVATHSNCRALCATERNLTDDQIRAIAERGGVVGIMLLTGFLAERTRAVEAPLVQEVLAAAKTHPGGFRGAADERRAEFDAIWRPTLDVVVDQMVHLVEVGGIECAAFGSDFDGLQYPPTDLPDCAAFPRLLGRLRERGFTEHELQRICWDNQARVLRGTFEP